MKRKKTKKTGARIEGDKARRDNLEGTLAWPSSAEPTDPNRLKLPVHQEPNQDDDTYQGKLTFEEMLAKEARNLKKTPPASPKRPLPKGRPKK